MTPSFIHSCIHQSLAYVPSFTILGYVVLTTENIVGVSRGNYSHARPSNTRTVGRRKRLITELTLSTAPLQNACVLEHIM